LGSATSSTRTQDQTDIARFWADGAGTATPPGHWNLIAQDVAIAKGNSLEDNARLFALLGIGLADAAIVSWDNKYEYDMWRPITAIAKADQDGNDATEADANWRPLLTTPPFPTYTSGHSTFSGTAATILAAFYGSDDFSFTTGAEGAIVSDRSFDGFWAAAEEAGASRIYGGIHFAFDNQDGLAHGRALGEWVSGALLRPVPEPSSFALVTLLAFACLVIARKS
jgi:hypothetical protein